MRYTYRDVNDFQKRNPTRVTREGALESMSVREYKISENHLILPRIVCNIQTGHRKIK